MKSKTPRLTRDEELQAYTDAIGALALAMAWQLDPIRLTADLRTMAHSADQHGHGPSAGLIDHIVTKIEALVLQAPGGGKH
jgi:hypothetical protein